MDLQHNRAVFADAAKYDASCARSGAARKDSRGGAGVASTGGAGIRFRLVGTDEATGREQFVAWFEPEHRIVQLAAGFFEKRFASVDWSILTPHECAH